MHIIFEGPDGGGKTRLLTHIAGKYGIEVAKRASRSESGPIVNVDKWCEDVEYYIFRDGDRQPRHVNNFYAFDRHAVISEPIYSTAIGRATAEMFNLPWWLTARRQAIYEHALVVFCLPDFDVIYDNAHNPKIPQMPGVTDNLHEIYMRYVNCWQNWGGPCVRYDYTATDRESFIQMIGKWVYL